MTFGSPHIQRPADTSSDFTPKRKLTNGVAVTELQAWFKTRGYAIKTPATIMVISASATLRLWLYQKRCRR